MSIGKAEDKDSFWDIEKILPPRMRHGFSDDTDTVPVSLGECSQPPSAESTFEIVKKPVEQTAEQRENSLTVNDECCDVTITDNIKTLHVNDTVSANIPHHKPYGRSSRPANTGDILQRDYRPISTLRYNPAQPLIELVEVWQWPRKYNFYEDFRSDAVKYHSYQGTETEKVPFFAFLPQYNAMTDAQLRYYLWWRHNIRRGKCLPADYSYVLLCLFEIINIPDLISPDLGSFLMCVLWFGYRERYPRLDKIVAEWLCDYCLIHRVVPPKRAEAKLAKYGAPNCSMPEFYINFDVTSKVRHADNIAAISSNYNWRESRYYNNDTSVIFERHMPSVLAEAFETLPDYSKIRTEKVSRDAFTGAICAYSIKRRIDVTYKPALYNQKNRSLITEIVKYSENGIRTLIGVSSRFSAKNIPNNTRKVIDEYFLPFVEQRLAEKNAKKKEKAIRTEERPEYEKLYDSPFDGELSVDTAAQIERDSWEITDQLVELFDSADRQVDETRSDHDAASFVAKKFDILENSNDSDDCREVDTLKGENDRAENSDMISFESALSADRDDASDQTHEKMLKKAVLALLEKDRSTFYSIASSLNLIPDTLVENINEISYTLIGDIAVETDDNGFFMIIDDYRKEMEEFADE